MANLARLFDDLTDVYEAMIDWPKRLANEEPFYRQVFERAGVRSVVDAACGTGRHAAMFHQWGLRVEGADISPRMIDRARAVFGVPPGLRWVVRGFDQPLRPVEPPGATPAHADREPWQFDAAICVGNSLALAPDVPTVERAVGQLMMAVRPGGVVVVQVLNLWRLADGPCLWQKAKRAVLPQGDAHVLKGVHRCGSRGYVDLVLTHPDSGALLHNESVPFLGLEAAELDRVARAADAAQIEFFGGYQEQHYDRNESIDLVMVARRG
jgi:SAM-dependent methyltransferase